jgi:hypothetical protein
MMQTVDDDIIGVRVTSVDHVLLVIADKKKDWTPHQERQPKHPILAHPKRRT